MRKRRTEPSERRIPIPGKASKCITNDPRRPTQNRCAVGGSHGPGSCRKHEAPSHVSVLVCLRPGVHSGDTPHITSVQSWLRFPQDPPKEQKGHI